MFLSEDRPLPGHRWRCSSSVYPKLACPFEHWTADEAIGSPPGLPPGLDHIQTSASPAINSLDGSGFSAKGRAGCTSPEARRSIAEDLSCASARSFAQPAIPQAGPYSNLAASRSAGSKAAGAKELQVAPVQQAGPTALKEDVAAPQQVPIAAAAPSSEPVQSPTPLPGPPDGQQPPLQLVPSSSLDPSAQQPDSRPEDGVVVKVISSQEKVSSTAHCTLADMSQQELVDAEAADAAPPTSGPVASLLPACSEASEQLPMAQDRTPSAGPAAQSSALGKIIDGTGVLAADRPIAHDTPLPSIKQISETPAAPLTAQPAVVLAQAEPAATAPALQEHQPVSQVAAVTTQASAVQHAADGLVQDSQSSEAGEEVVVSQPCTQDHARLLPICWPVESDREPEIRPAPHPEGDGYSALPQPGLNCLQAETGQVVQSSIPRASAAMTQPDSSRSTTTAVRKVPRQARAKNAGRQWLLECLDSPHALTFQSSSPPITAPQQARPHAEDGCWRTLTRLWRKVLRGSAAASTAKKQPSAQSPGKLRQMDSPQTASPAAASTPLACSPASLSTATSAGSAAHVTVADHQERVSGDGAAAVLASCPPQPPSQAPAAAVCPPGCDPPSQLADAAADEAARPADSPSAPDVPSQLDSTATIVGAAGGTPDAPSDEPANRDTAAAQDSSTSAGNGEPEAAEASLTDMAPPAPVPAAVSPPLPPESRPLSFHSGPPAAVRDSDGAIPASSEASISCSAIAQAQAQGKAIVCEHAQQATTPDQSVAAPPSAPQPEPDAAGPVVSGVASQPEGHSSSCSSEARPVQQALAVAADSADAGRLSHSPAAPAKQRSAAMPQPLAFPLQNVQREAQLPVAVRRYYRQRYELWHKYSAGVRMDEHGWFTVTPETVANHQTDKLYELQQAWGLRRLVDGMCGCGGNVVSMASSACQEVIAVDTRPERLAMCLHNAEVYGVRHKVTTQQQDFFALAPTLQADGIFISPPWGGPSYVRSGQYDVLRPFEGLQHGFQGLLLAMLSGLRTVKIGSDGQDIKEGVAAIFLPKNANRAQIQSCIPPGAHFTIEEDAIGSRPRRVKGITVYVWVLAC